MRISGEGMNIRDGATGNSYGLSVLEVSILLAILVPIFTVASAMANYIILNEVLRGIGDKYASDGLIRPMRVDGAGRAEVDGVLVRKELRRLVVSAKQDLEQYIGREISPSNYRIEADFLSVEYCPQSGRFLAVRRFPDSNVSEGSFIPSDPHRLERALVMVANETRDAIPLPSLSISSPAGYLHSRVLLGLRLSHSLEGTATGRILNNLAAWRNVSAEGLKVVMLRGGGVAMFFSNRRRDLSALLVKRIGRRMMAEIARGCDDPRNLLALAAERLGVSEDNLARDCASRGSYIYCQFVYPFDLELMRGLCTLSDLYKAASIIQANGNLLAGVVCADPGLLKLLPSVLHTGQVLLAPWRRIRAALEQSEDNHRNNAGLGLKDDEICKRVLILVIEEAKRFGAERVTISLSDSPSYCFNIDDGNEAKGTLSPAVRARLSRVLRESIGAGRVSIGYSGLSESFEVSSAGDERFLISWDNDRAFSPFRSVEMVAGVSDPVQAPVGEAGSLDGSRVLLIDDNSCFAKVFEAYLGRQGITTLHALSCEEALNRLNCLPCALPDLVVCDVHMTGMDGFGFLQEFRKKFANLPIIMLTSDEDVETELRLLRNGADAFVGKTQDTRILSAHVGRLISRRRAA